MTREEAIQYAEKRFDMTSYHLEMGYINRGLYSIMAREHDFLRVAIPALKEQVLLAKKTSDKKTSDWISVEERLPEEDGFYLIYGPTVYTNIKWYDQRNLAQYLWKHDVTHWMPLPEAPEVEG